MDARNLSANNSTGENAMGKVYLVRLLSGVVLVVLFLSTIVFIIIARILNNKMKKPSVPSLKNFLNRKVEYIKSTKSVATNTLKAKKDEAIERPQLSPVARLDNPQSFPVAQTNQQTKDSAPLTTTKGSDFKNTKQMKETSALDENDFHSAPTTNPSANENTALSGVTSFNSVNDYMSVKKFNYTESKASSELFYPNNYLYDNVVDDNSIYVNVDHSVKTDKENNYFTSFVNYACKDSDNGSIDNIPSPHSGNDNKDDLTEKINNQYENDAGKVNKERDLGSYRDSNEATQTSF